jgi:hypothetical protein
MSELRIKLEGDTARLGQVSAADVAQLILGFEKAAAQAAAVVLGKPKTTSGRYRAVIEQAVRFKLVSIEEGSVEPVLKLPDLPPDLGAFDIDVATLGETAIDTLLEAADEHGPQPSHPLVSKALLDIADRLHIGERYEAIVVTEVPNGNRRAARHARIDGSVRTRLQAYVEQAGVMASRPEDLTGVLFEADFEKRTARLRTPTQGAVDISFAPDHDDNIHTALRQKATIRGDVVYDPHTREAKSVRLSEVVRGIEQLALDSGDFWRTRSLDELAEQQGASNPIDPERLYDAEVTDQERDAFMAAIAELD